jgi:DNA-binding FadR family transcriptional regulator
LLEALGRSIVVGEYRNRSFPTEAELAKIHQVSRSVTREAVKMLSAKGLVSARPKQGTFVQPESKWNLFDSDVLRWLLERRTSIALLREFNELRVSVEPQAAKLAATRAAPSSVAAVGAALQRMRNAEEGRDQTLDADIAFHIAVLQASGNPFYAQFSDVVETALRTSIRITNRIAGRSAAIGEHAAVYEAIAAGLPEKAEQAMRALIENVLRLIERVAVEDEFS